MTITCMCLRSWKILEGLQTSIIRSHVGWDHGSLPFESIDIYIILDLSAEKSNGPTRKISTPRCITSPKDTFATWTHIEDMYITLHNFTKIWCNSLSFSHSSPSHRNVAAISPAPLQWTTTCKKTHGDGEDQDRRPNLYWIWGLNLKAPQKHHMSKALAASNDESNLSFQMFGL